MLFSKLLVFSQPADDVNPGSICVFHYAGAESVNTTKMNAEFPPTSVSFCINSSPANKSMKGSKEIIDQREKSTNYWGYLAETFSKRGDLVGIIGDLTGFINLPKFKFI